MMLHYLVVALIAALLGGGAAWHVRDLRAGVEIAELKALHAQERQRHADAARAAEAQARATEQARSAAMERIDLETRSRHQALAADAAAARRAADSLRQHIARLVGGGSAPDNAVSAGDGSAAAGPGLVLADLFGRADDRAGELAAFADQAHAAGLACERAYDALRSP